MQLVFFVCGISYMFCSLAYPISSVRALFILVLVAFSWFARYRLD